MVLHFLTKITFTFLDEALIQIEPNCGEMPKRVLLATVRARGRCRRLQVKQMLAEPSQQFDTTANNCVFGETDETNDNEFRFVLAIYQGIFNCKISLQSRYSVKSSTDLSAPLVVVTAHDSAYHHHPHIVHNVLVFGCGDVHLLRLGLPRRPLLLFCGPNHCRNRRGTPIAEQ